MSAAYLYGMISPSTLHLLRKDFVFPAANQYAEIAESHPSIGGEAANSAIILSKLGLRTKLDGNWLHPRSAPEVLARLATFGIDTSRISVNDQGGTAEIVIADGQSRTVFGNYASFHSGPKQWNDPQAEDIRAASIVCLDPYFREQSRRAAELCVEHQKPYVTLDCRHDDYVAQHAAAVVISHELRDQAYQGSDQRTVFLEYQKRCRGLVLFTFGADELWSGRSGEERRVHQPYAVDAVDSTGAGDSFRGAVAYGIAMGWKDDELIEFASATAACVCLTLPHTLNAPGLDGIRAFMNANRNRALHS